MEPTAIQLTSIDPPSSRPTSRIYVPGEDFIKAATRSRAALDFDDDDEELRDQLDQLEHPLFDALHRDTVANTHQKIRTPWKRNLYLLFESPTSSPSAFVIHVATTTLIALSAFITILETLPVFHASSSHVWFGLETALVVLFTVEYIGRLLAHSETWGELLGWMGSFFAAVDLAAIVPYYIMIAIRADTTTFFRFSILRTFRLLRVFRPFRYSNTIMLTIEVMYLAVKRSKEALFALAFFVGMALIVFSTLLYFAERGTWDDTLSTFVNSDGDPSQFESIPAAAWFVLVTITTVGYGEIIPRSFLGRLITLPLLMFGLLLIALPSFVLGREFASVWDGMGGTKMLRMVSQRNKAAENAPAPRDQENGGGSPTSPDEPRAEQNRLINNHSYPPARHHHETPATPEMPTIPYSPTFRLRRRRNSEADVTGISNLKLAENQQVLSGQLEELMQVVQALRDEVRTRV